MIEELNTASLLLSSALDRYVAICSSIHKTYFESSSSATILPKLSHIVAQGQLVAAMELKLCTVKYTIARAHNSSPSLVPVHALPTELMEQIFLSVPECNGQHRCPEVLSQVCYKWHKISFALPSLWRYIVIPFKGGNANVAWVRRGLEFASRAHPLLLDVLFYTQRISTSLHPPSDTNTLRPFAENIASPARSLEFLFNSDQDLADHHPILETYFNFCKPGVLKTLITAYRDLHNDPFPGVLVGDSAHIPEYMVDSCQAVEISNLDRLLEGVATLQLRGIYPIWTSQAYHGLVELRLVHLDSYLGRHGRTPLISEQHLRGVLNASPSLKIIQFSIRITEVTSTNASVVPIKLDHLEMLNINYIEEDMVGTFLRWISPGSRPLRFALCYTGDAPLLDDPDVRAFFSRSNVTEIYAGCVDYLTIFNLLDLFPHLRTLLWHDYHFPTPTQLERARFPISHPSLESLFVDGIIEEESFLDLVGIPSTLRRVVISDAYLKMGFIERLKATSGIPNIVVDSWVLDW